MVCRTVKERERIEMQDKREKKKKKEDAAMA
jgi:hypothetical protein